MVSSKFLTPDSSDNDHIQNSVDSAEKHENYGKTLAERLDTSLDSQSTDSETTPMAITLGLPQDDDMPLLKPRIVVVGVGGAGGNAVNNMIQSELEGVDFLVANTDAQALSSSRSSRAIQLGAAVTQGLGAGARPDVGRRAAEESLEEIVKELQGANMAFITAGMGGGTGTGAAPVIASAARELGILTVGVVTRPFNFEGARRSRLADKGIEELSQYVDTLIVVPNQNLFRIANEKTTFADAFKMADDVLHSGVRSVTDLMIMPGLINLDFADVRTVMDGMGKAMMGTGEADGDDRGIKAAEMAIANPLLDDVSMTGAKGVLINITGGPDLGLCEVDEAANRIRQEVDEDANIIFGSCFDERLDGKIRVSVVATGIGGEVSMRQEELQKLATAMAEPIMQPKPVPKITTEQPEPPQPPTPPSGGPKPDVETPVKDSDPLGLSLFDRPVTPSVQLDAFIPKAPAPTKDDAYTHASACVEAETVTPPPSLIAEPVAETSSFAHSSESSDQDSHGSRSGRGILALFAAKSNAPTKLHAPEPEKREADLLDPLASSDMSSAAYQPELRAETPVSLDPEMDSIPAFLRRQAN